MHINFEFSSGLYTFYCLIIITHLCIFEIIFFLSWQEHMRIHDRNNEGNPDRRRKSRTPKKIYNKKLVGDNDKMIDAMTDYIDMGHVPQVDTISRILTSDQDIDEDTLDMSDFTSSKHSDGLIKIEVLDSNTSGDCDADRTEKLTSSSVDCS